MWAMFASRQPLLWAFAGGCLSGALIILSGVGAVAIWRGETGPHESARQHAFVERAPELGSLAVGNTTAMRQSARDDDLDDDKAKPQSEPTAAADDHHEGAHADPAVQKDTPTPDAGSTNESGSSVADVLVRLETAYRQGLVPTPASDTSASDVPAGSDTHPAVADRAPVPQPSATATEAPPREVPAPVTTTVIVINNTAPAPADSLPAAGAAPADVRPAEAAPAVSDAALASASDALARGGYTSQTQNVHIDNLHQGDVYQVQQIQMLQYMQALGLSPYGGYAAPVAVPAQHNHYHTTLPGTGSLPVSAPPFPSYISSVTNPDNPWGYHFRSPRLTH
jgi:hypothetical protein